MILSTEAFNCAPIDAENQAALENSAIVCVISGEHLFEERYKALLDADYDELLAVGSRVVELERRLINNRRGFDRSDDVLPYDLPGFDDTLDEYYEGRGWNPDGTVPSERTEDTGTAV